ncbi:hypothetical protein AB0N07_34075 [Streptomyces sp. NPDC051172]
MRRRSRPQAHAGPGPDGVLMDLRFAGTDSGIDGVEAIRLLELT